MSYRIETIAGILTESYVSSSLDYNKLDGATHVFYFLIAGNPGTPQFYEDFCNHLFLRLMQECTDRNIIYHVHCCAHANHHIGGVFEGSPTAQCSFGLSHQIQHHVTYMEHSIQKLKSDFSISDHSCSVCLVGHSIGAYIALEALRKSELLTAMTQQVYFLMPFVRWDNIPAYHRRSMLAVRALFPVVNTSAVAVARVFASLPLALRSSVMTVLLPQTPGPLRALVADKVITRRIIANFFAMAIDEINCIHASSDEFFVAVEALALRRVRVLTLYTDQDIWAPAQDGALLAEAARRAGASHYARTVYEPGLTHSFVMLPSAVRRVTELILAEDSSRSVGSRHRRLKCRL